MSVVRNELLISGSCLRPCRNKVVPIPSEADQSLYAQQDDRRPCIRGPSSVLDDTHGRISVEYGDNGRKRSEREASKQLSFRTQSELYGMAFGTGDKLQVCALRFEGIGRQHCQLGLELFPEFSQPAINNGQRLRWIISEIEKLETCIFARIDCTLDLRSNESDIQRKPYQNLSYCNL